MDRHAGHRLEPLVATGEDYVSGGKRFDPMSVGFFEVSSGAETLLLRPQPVDHRRGGSVRDRRWPVDSSRRELGNPGRSDPQRNEIAFLLGAG
jgi:hypothetical protein